MKRALALLAAAMLALPVSSVAADTAHQAVTALQNATDPSLVALNTYELLLVGPDARGVTIITAYPLLVG
jgi:hypothetical protein